MRLCKISGKTSQDKYKKITERKNMEARERFLAVPFKNRLVFVPHCLRNTGKCKAKESGSYFVCLECGSCKIGAISKKVNELGYKGIFILKGGRTIEKLVEELKPGAVLGVACYFEGAQAFELLETKNKNKIPVQFIALSRDGCSNTDVNLTEVLKTLSK